MAVDSKNKYWKEKTFWKELGIWFGLDILVAGFLCVGILLLTDLFLGHKGWFYVVNKVGYSGYFYAWSMALLAGSLSSLLRCWVAGREPNGKILLVILSIVGLCIVEVGYLSYDEEMKYMGAEKIVKSIDLKELAGKELYTQYDNEEMDADTLIARIWIQDTISAEDVLNYIDKEQLAEILLQVKVKIEDPRIHWNLFYFIMVVVSFGIALASFILAYPKSKGDNKGGVK